MDAFHSDGSYNENSKSEQKFNGLRTEELLQEVHGRELISFSDIDQSLDKYRMLKELMHNANCVAAYGDEETQKAYFEHVFRHSLGMNLHRYSGESHCYDDFVSHLAAVNKELDEKALEDARLAYDLNFKGDGYETQ